MMNKLYFWLVIWIVGILVVLALKHMLAKEPDFNQVIEQNPTAAGELEKRPSYFKGK